MPTNPVPPLTPQEYLFSLEHHGIKLGLETITSLLTRAGRPQDQYPTLHVAGTNGKGSVVAMLSAMLQAAGYRTGRFTSPHLIHLNERFLVDQRPIPSPELDDGIQYFREIATQRELWPPTFFEMNAAIAFRWFAQRAVECAVIEVGLGGRFDATNVIRPEISIITNIDFDHMRFLGNTLEEIAFEKAGIIKEDRPVIIGETRPGPASVILARANELNSPALLLGRDFHYTTQGPGPQLTFSFQNATDRIGPVQLGLAGHYQGPNAAAATAAALELTRRFPRLNAETITAGLAAAHWPCRLEHVLQSPPVWIDVAHNAAGAHVLAREFTGPCITLMGVSNDKDAATMIKTLAPITRHFIFTQFSGPRALPARNLAPLAPNTPSTTEPSLSKAIQQGLDRASVDCPLLITGSIFTAGEARAILINDHGAPALQF